MDEAAILGEFLLFISSSQLFQHSRLCARPLLKAWAMDGSISLHAPPEALYKERDEKKRCSDFSACLRCNEDFPNKDPALD
ncbi:hypothetical protein QQF64_002226 [Cirrhinus molitorella]|uniref:Uncharacterized protein n=1 Tax=Cirrhinus molitorella TaxID=172907 RepID=A0ABR3MPH9_9TELE